MPHFALNPDHHKQTQMFCFVPHVARKTRSKSKSTVKSDCFCLINGFPASVHRRWQTTKKNSFLSGYIFTHCIYHLSYFTDGLVFFFHPVGLFLSGDMFSKSPA